MNGYYIKQKHEKKDLTFIEINVFDGIKSFNSLIKTTSAFKIKAINFFTIYIEVI